MGCGLNNKRAHQKQKRKSVILYSGQFIRDLKENIFSTYSIKYEIGSGSFGRVVAAVHNLTNESRAIKIINKYSIRDEEMRSKIMNEVDIMKRLDHPNIVKLYEFHEDEFNLYLIMDLCTGGELLESILTNKCFSEYQAADYMKQLISTVVYMHSLHIVHRDLKPENMLIENAKSSNIKLIDFGASIYYASKKPMTLRVGTVSYIAPEVINQKYTEKCDIWSCGVIMYLLLTGMLPFKHKDRMKTIELIKSGNYLLKGDIFESISDKAKDLIRKMLEVNPEKRLTALQVYNHPWFQITLGPQIQQCYLDSVSINLKTFHETSKLQRAVIRFIVSQLLTSTEKNELTNIFKEFDKSGLGKIGATELEIYWKKIFSQEINQDDIGKILQRIDTDRSGYIDYSEFLAAAMDRKKLLSSERLDAAFIAFDNDKNGKISALELKEMLDNNQDLEIDEYTNLIKEVDQNGDGCVDLTEFKIMMLSLLN